VTRAEIPPPVTRVMDAAQAWLPRRMAAVEERLRDRVAGHGEALRAEAEATLEAGGKRLRPLLVLLCAGPAAGEEAVRAAAAIELVHMATLVHDDVLDDAPLRRGRPTVVARAGRSMATSVGDLMLAGAFAELADAGDGAERQVTLLADASTALARGELMQRRDAFDTSIPAERYLQRCKLKTARLFECACRIGRADADAELTEFGGQIGLAFQLLDDVLDVSGPPERTGKARGTDLLDGTVTLPLILARERDPELAAPELRALDEAAAAELCDRIAATGVLEEVRAEATERVDRAKRRLAGAELEAHRRELLALVADGVVERYA
jgi:geranylgeranyl pyrophosphate synthase